MSGWVASQTMPNLKVEKVGIGIFKSKLKLRCACSNSSIIWTGYNILFHLQILVHFFLY